MAEAASKKPSLQDMSREDLMQRCKNLLQLAQKAKAAKDDAISELAKVKEAADKASVLEEMVGNLQEQKLQEGSEKEAVQRDLKKSKLQIDQQMQNMESLMKRCQEAETCSESKRRQVSRLTDENDELLHQVDTLDQALMAAKQELELHGAARMSQLESKNQELQATIICLKEKEKGLLAEQQKESVCKRDEEIAQLKNTVQELENGNQQLSTDNDQLRNECKQVKEELVELDKVKEENKGLAVELDQVKERQALNATVEKELEETKMANEHLNGQLVSLKEDLKKANEQLNLSAQERSSLTEHLERVQTDNGDKQEAISSLQKNLEELNEQWKYTLSEKEKESDNLKVQLEELELKVKESLTGDGCKQDLLAMELEEANARISQLTILQEETAAKLRDMESRKNNEEEARDNQIEELEHTLSKESERAADFKDLELEKVTLQNNLEALNETWKDALSEKDALAQHCDSLKAQLEEMEAKVSELSDKLYSESKNSQDVKDEAAAYIKKYEEQIAEIQGLQEKLNEKGVELEQLRMTVKDYQETKLALETATIERDRLLTKMEDMQLKNIEAIDALTANHHEHVAQLKREHVDVVKHVQLEKDEMVTKLEAETLLSKKRLEELEAETDNAVHCKAEATKYAQMCEALNAKCDEKSAENGQLLDEIREISGELKKRGEKLSKFQQAKEELEAKVAQANVELNQVKVDDEGLRRQVQVAEEEVAKLKQQLEHLPSSRSLDESQSEAAMSTSTVSKAEESSRMVDIESTFEERYVKLKVVAIKLKKKTVEQERKLAELGLLQESSGHHAMTAAKLSANFANLQSEFDSAQDMIESQKKEISSLIKDVKMAVEECSATKEKLAESHGQVSNLTYKVETIEQQMACDQRKMSDQDIQIQGQAKTIDEQTKENAGLKERLMEVDKQVESLTGAGRKHDLLDLELEEAETRISQLTILQEETAAKLRDMESKKNNEEEARENRERQIEELEHTLSKESERAADFKAKLCDARTSLSASEALYGESKAENEALQKEVDRMRVDNERLSCQLADISGNAMASTQSLTARNESLQKMVGLLETDLERKNRDKGELEEKLSSVEKEFDNYRVRAQSVLRQAKEQDSAIGAKAQELATLERVVQNLNEKITDMSTQMSASEMELRHVQEDHDRLMERHSALLSDMATKERAARDKQEQLVKLANSAERARQDAIASLQEQTEALRQTYRSQMEALESKHSAEVAKSQKQIDALDNQVIRLQMAVSNAKQQSSGSPANHGDIVTLLEREAAEGSDAIEAVHRPTSAAGSPAQNGNQPRLSRAVSVAKSDDSKQPLSPVPLDQLLLQQDVHGDSKGTTTILNSNVDPTVMEQRAAAAERRLAHMTSLLSEAESENARLSQLSAVLKEEIRSYQRSEERSKHIENLEYVKNIIVKFVTMPGSDEKARLIPVLSTILRLSPAEVANIQASVNADTDATASTADLGWSSYLGLWSP